MRFFLLVVCCLAPYLLQAKILIFTIVFNRPEFIPLQKQSLDAFLLDPYDLVVYNNAADPLIAKDIEETCREWDVGHVRIPDKDRRNLDSCTSHATALNYATGDILKSYRGKALLLENDDFLMQPLSFEEQMQDVDFGYKPYCWMWDAEGKWLGNPTITYPHANLASFDFSTIEHPELINWHGTNIDGYLLDTGGQMYHFLYSEPPMRTKTIDEVPSWDYHRGKDNIFALAAQKELIPESYVPLLEQLVCEIPSEVQFINQYTVLHYWIGSNWDNKEQAFHDRKFQAVSHFLEQVIYLRQEMTSSSDTGEKSR